MALEAADIEIIRASWLAARKDSVASGCLLFKKLFTDFPQYLQLFPQFPDLDLDHMRENKRLLKHAVKVIETVSFVVDAIGDDQQATALNDALLNLVRSHLRRKIGLDKFRNLGGVLIEFVCELNNHGMNGANSQQPQDSAAREPLKQAWSKLYAIILDLVQKEEAAGAATATA